MSTKVKSTEASTNTIKYYANKHCMFRGNYVTRGTIIELPADDYPNHACIVPYTSEPVGKEGFYDPNSDYIKEQKAKKIMAGVLK